MRFVRAIVPVLLLATLAGCATTSRTPQVSEAPTAMAVAAQHEYEEALAALQAHRLERAEILLLKLTRSHPRLAGPYVNLGMLYGRRREWDKAETMLRQAVALNPKRADAHNELGIVLRRLGRFDKARDAYEQALRLQPDYANAQLNLGILYDLYLLQPAEALQHYERYQQLRADDEVGKWIVDLKRRTDASPKTAMNRRP